jgi:hypothetical protein
MMVTGGGLQFKGKQSTAANTRRASISCHPVMDDLLELSMTATSGCADVSAIEAIEAYLGVAHLRGRCSMVRSVGVFDPMSGPDRASRGVELGEEEL